jgi:hypothetical protein
MSVARNVRMARLRQTRFFKRRRVREQLRQARRVLALVNARKLTVVAVVGAAIVAVLALGATAALLLRHMLVG